MTRVPVFVPTGALAAVIARGSGIVGTVKHNSGGRVLIDYEGNLYDVLNLERYANRVRRAYERHVEKYPTVARSLVKPDELLHVGWFDADTGTVTVTDVDPLSDWLDGVESDDLTCS